MLLIYLRLPYGVCSIQIAIKEAVLKTVNLGDDTDTVGAVTGGLAGLFYGFENIPSEWIQVLQRKEWIEQITKSENVCFREGDKTCFV